MSQGGQQEERNNRWWDPDRLRRLWSRVPLDGLRSRLQGFELHEFLAELRRNRLWQVVGALSAFLLLLLVLTPLVDAPLRKPLPDRLQVTGFFENSAGGMYVDSFPSLQNRADDLDIVNGFWYSLGPDGELAIERPRKEVLEFARRAGLEVYALFHDKRAGERTLAFLDSPGGRSKAVESILAAVEDLSYDGITIDFVDLRPDQGEEFVLFLRELRASLPRRVTLSVAVPPKEDLPEERHAAYDYAKIASYADYLILMAIDRHNPLTGPGPIAPVPWVRSSIQDALGRGVGPHKLVLAVGLYGYDWPVKAQQGTVQYLPLKDVLARAEEVGAGIEEDEESQNSYFRYERLGIQRVVWFPDREDVHAFIDMAAEARLRGIAFWRLGFETDEVWEIVRQNIPVNR